MMTPEVNAIMECRADILCAAYKLKSGFKDDLDPIAISNKLREESSRVLGNRHPQSKCTWKDMSLMLASTCRRAIQILEEQE